MANKKTKWTKAELKYFTDRIQSTREEQAGEVGALRQNTRIADESTSSGDSTYSSHMADAGTDQGEREKAYYWLSRENNYMKHLDRALEKLEDGTFGICQTCGELIGKERLEEVPHTSECFSCKSKPKRPVEQ